MKRKIAAILLICIICGVFFSGCVKKVEQKNSELTVYIGIECSGMLELAVDIFEQTYPDVEVQVIGDKVWTEDELLNEAERMATELMAGEGADVFLIQRRWDIEKMIDRKVFADLSPFFDNDPYFQGDNWEQKIFEGGCKGDYRYAIPTEYGIPMLVTSEEAIKESGIDISRLNDFSGFMNETEKYMNSVQNDKNARRLFRISLVHSYCMLWAGYPVVDWERQTLDLENEQIKRYFDWYYMVEQQSKEDYYYSSFEDAAHIRDGRLLFGNLVWGTPFDAVIKECRTISSYDKPVMIPIRNLEGGINAYAIAPLAVRANSENLLNAYRFIQIYMSTEVQTSVASRSQGSFKVNKEAQEYNYEEMKDYSFGQEVKGFPAECPTFSREEYEELMGYVGEVDTVMCCAPRWLTMLREQMESYMNGECTYEEAIAQAKYELEIYVSE